MMFVWPKRIPGGTTYRQRSVQPPPASRQSRNRDAGETIRSGPLCAAQARPALSVGPRRQKGRYSASKPLPCRRRETSFREPGWRGLASRSRYPRRPRLAGTPSGVSDAGRGHS